MKIPIYILLFTISFLFLESVNKSILFTSETEHSTCDKHKCNSLLNQKSPDNQSEEREGERCNPFLSCCAFIPCEKKTFSQTIYTNIFIIQIFEFDSFLSSWTNFDIWQPPKFV